MILLVNPPVAKPCEPPSGLTYLAGALRAHSIPYHILDANTGGIMHLLRDRREARDTWTRRALRNRDVNMGMLKSIESYANRSRYEKSVLELNHLLDRSSELNSVRVTLEDYEDPLLSPVRTADLLYAADHPERNLFYGYFSDFLPDLIERLCPDYVGFSLSYLSQALSTFALVGFVKAEFPGLKIVLGGSLITSWANSSSWKNPFQKLVDHVISGPGEIPLVKLAGKTENLRRHYKPVYDSFIADDYLSPGLIMPYRTSTGCYWGKCTFCPETAEGNRYTQLSPKKAVHDLRELSDEINPVLIHLTDNAVSPAVLKCLADDPPGVPWYGFVRVTEELADAEFCARLAGSGCAMLKLGVESGSQGVLDTMRKGSTVPLNSKALKTVSASGIATYVYLLFGTSCEDEDEARMTLDFTVEHGEYIDFMNVAIFNLPLMSPDTATLNLSSFYEGDLSLYANFVHPKSWDRRRVRKFVDKEFKRHPVIRPILQRQPPFFTSNHAAFFSRLYGNNNPPG